MPPVQIFEVLRARVKKQGALLPAEKRAMFWFANCAGPLKRWQEQTQGMRFAKLQNREFTKQLIAANQAQPGFFYFFNYHAKWEKELPYWDAFPFTLVLHRYPDGFLGLNFHYLDYRDRARLFDALYPLRQGRKPSKNENRSEVRDIRMRLRLTYAILKIARSNKYPHWKACIKRYLTTHIRTPLLKVGAKEWDVALFLPVHLFQKAPASTVWMDSKQIGVTARLRAYQNVA